MLTLKKVKELVEAPSHAKRTPSPKMLFEEGIVLLRREFDQGSHLTVYNSGYVLFSAGKRNTVFHIHDCCGDYAYDAAEGKGDVIKEEYFENCEWHIRTLFEGERKMEDNQAKCEGAGRSNVCVSYHPLNGVERLQIMYETFHQEEQQKFDFSYDRILQSGMTTKDFIAPTSFLFKSGKDFMMGDTYGAASYLNILAPELTDKVLAEFLDMDKNLVVSIHVQSVDQLKAIKLIKGKITDLDRMKIEEQKKAVRSGYDMEIIPSDLATYGGEAKKILDDLQSRNERILNE